MRWILKVKNKKKAGKSIIGDNAPVLKYSPFPRPVCLEKCSMDIKKGYEADIIKTLRAFSSREMFERKNAHKLKDYKIYGSEAWSIDVKSRNDNCRMLFYLDNNICKITDFCSTDTH